MVPTSTGAAKAISLVLPRLEGRLEGSAVRVPTPNVSLVDLCFIPEKATTAEEINAAIKAAAEGPMKGILGYDTDPTVSIDYNHDSHSSTFAAPQTKVTKDGMVRVVSWYDNEWGFANRMIDTGRRLAELAKA
jgi:glyceraldehyde 3-phosphate dehydrogenase